MGLSSEKSKKIAMGLREYQIVGRKKPEARGTDKIYRMRIFAANQVVAKSRFWYFMSQLNRLKKANGEILAVNEIHEKKPDTVKNFGVWIRYYSRSGQHNIFKEYRAESRVRAIEKMYSDMAGRHRVRFSSLQILDLKPLAASQVKRPDTLQFVDAGISFPLPHRQTRPSAKRYRRKFVPKRLTTFYG